MAFKLPPRTQTEKGAIRRVGFEIEFGGVSLSEAAATIHSLFGGTIQQKSAFNFIVATPYGEFHVEADARFLSEKKYQKYVQKMGIKADSKMVGHLEKVLEKVTGVLLPFEISTPPLPLDNLYPAEMIRQRLCEKSAQGTRTNLFAAFGCQLNPELPDFEVGTVLSYTRAFLLLFDWLREESQITLARDIAPYINPFPQDYISLVLDSSYNPNIDQFIYDYLFYNPTRNRPLDLLPLFSFLNKDLVYRFDVEKHLIKPRPTFHYRLPNSEIDDPSWTLALEWNKWVEVEKLSIDTERIGRMSQDYFDSRESHVLFVRSHWVEKTRRWLASQT